MQTYHVPIFNSQGKGNGELGPALQEQPGDLAISSKTLSSVIIIRNAGVKIKDVFISQPPGGAKPSPFTQEGHQSALGAGPAPQAEKPMGQDSALQKRFELVFHKLGQACCGL